MSRRPPHLTRAHFQGPLRARILLWWRVRRGGALLLAPFRVTGKAARSASARITVGPGTRIGQFAWFGLVDKDARIDIGSDCILSASLCISAMDRISIGDGTAIAERCLITDHGHDHAAYLEPVLAAGGVPSFGWDLTEAKPVVIGNGAHIGVNVVIMPGVHVGDGAVIGANSVVTSSVPPYTVVAGVPARTMRTFAPPPEQSRPAVADRVTATTPGQT
jgi:acetyltransferase-like isoleucine patch superfamily enzyme